MLTAVHPPERPVLQLVNNEPDPLDPLTDREREILALVAEGLSNRAIRQQLWIAPKTLERHIRHVFAKLDVTDRDGTRNSRVLATRIWLRSPSGGADGDGR
jgi:ATP/maltotriose-dependent transcriptional regulator MalT